MSLAQSAGVLTCQCRQLYRESSVKSRQNKFPKISPTNQNRDRDHSRAKAGVLRVSLIVALLKIVHQLIFCCCFEYSKVLQFWRSFSFQRKKAARSYKKIASSEENKCSKSILERK